MGETTEKVKGLYPKLLEIQRRILGLEKDRNTKSQQNPNGYAYVTGAKVLSFVKPLMNEYGLILKQEITGFDNTRQDYKTKFAEKSEILTRVDMLFTWVDAETGEKDVNTWGANGMNDWEKGLGSALTYAERYFLLKYFHISTDEDDIDNPDRQTTEPVAIKLTPAPPTATTAPATQPIQPEPNPAVATGTTTLTPAIEATTAVKKTKAPAVAKEPAKSGTPSAGISPSQEFSTPPAAPEQKASDDERRVKAKAAFKALDQVAALKYIVKTLNKPQYSTVETYVDSSDITEVLNTYNAIKLLEAK